jgi:hypothetical protein
MFAYVAMLVDEDLFDIVEIFFLIVGHTHASIDQYFSILAKRIKTKDFIGSPLALAALLACSQQSRILSGRPSEDNRKRYVSSRPLDVKKLSAMFDLKSCLGPLINKSIQYYPIPHYFRFEKFNGICAMQYGIYSAQKTLLPERPDIAGKINVVIIDVWISKSLLILFIMYVDHRIRVRSLRESRH